MIKRYCDYCKENIENNKMKIGGKKSLIQFKTQ